jgi:hypothetical protein
MFRVGVSGNVSEMSDVYSFGVFLLELVTGQEALHIDSLGSNESFFQWVCNMFFFVVLFSREISS